MPCFSTDLLTILPMSITGECQSARIRGSITTTTSRDEPMSGAYSVCWYLMSEPGRVMSEVTRRRTRRTRREKRRAHLQGFPSHHTVEMPTCGAFLMASPSGTPAA